MNRPPFAGLTLKYTSISLVEALMRQHPSIDIFCLAFTHALHPSQFEQAFKGFAAMNPSSRPHHIFMRMAKALCMTYPPDVEDSWPGFELEEFEWNFVNHILALPRSEFLS